MLLWTGIFIINVPTLLAIGPAAKIGPVRVPPWLGAASRLVLGALSPLFLAALFSGQANGVPPLNQGFDLTLTKFGKDADWLAYDACTPRLVPNLASILAWLRGK